MPLKLRALLAPLLLLLTVGAALAQTDPLPSWNDGTVKSAIIAFVGKVTDNGGADYVAPEVRIATFDNDGTLWVEQPVYSQLLFAFDRIKAMAPEHPEWKSKQPYPGRARRRHARRSRPPASRRSSRSSPRPIPA